MISSLSNKTALVTGASRGIGRATAFVLASRGAYVLAHYHNGAAEAEAVVAEINRNGGKADTARADLSVADGPHALAAQVRKIVRTRLDILVANAGTYKAASIENTTLNDFDELFAVNVRAPFLLVQQLAPIMDSGGSNVLISSLAARAAFGTIAAYAATKGAIDTFGETLRIRARRPRDPCQCCCGRASLPKTARIKSRPTSGASAPPRCKRSSG